MRQNCLFYCTWIKLVWSLLGLLSAFLSLQRTLYADKSIFSISSWRNVEISNVKLLFSYSFNKTSETLLIPKTPSSLYHKPHRLPGIIYANICNRYAVSRYLHHTASPLHFSLISRQGLAEPFCSDPCRCPLLLSKRGPCSHMCISASSTTVPTQHWLFLGGKTSCRHWPLLGPRPHGYQLSL